MEIPKILEPIFFVQKDNHADKNNNYFPGSNKHVDLGPWSLQCTLESENDY